MNFLVVLLGVIVSSSVFAEDIGGVGVRMTCADIQAQISELSAVEEPDTDTIDELTRLKADYRRSCVRAARGRKSSAGARVIIEATEVQDETETDVVEAQSEEGVEEVIDTTLSEEVQNTEEMVPDVVDVGPTEDELLAQELANLDAGLCPDGTEPNKFGCCEGEQFKDLGNTVFACCPKEGNGECFPPIK